MLKVLQKIMLLVAVTTVVGHSIFPHIHHNEITLGHDQHHHDSNSKHDHDDEQNSNDQHHDLLSFAQLEDNYIPAKKLYSTFTVPIEFVAALTIIFVDNSRVATKTHYGCCEEYPPPDNHFCTSYLRGPPTV